MMSSTPKGAPPPYVVHTVEEKDVTVDWFFGSDRGSGHWGTKLVQLLAIIVGWFFVILPVVITASALLHRDDPTKGWWGYHEGFVMWDLTIALLGILLVLFVIGFLVLHVIDRRAARRHAHSITYDQPRLAQRLEIAEELYAGKFGPEELRLRDARVSIEPYGDLETYELRGLYREYGVD